MDRVRNEDVRATCGKKKGVLVNVKDEVLRMFPKMKMTDRD